MKPFSWIRWVLLCVVLIVVSTGCSVKESPPIDPPQQVHSDDEFSLEGLSGVVEQEHHLNHAEVCVYVKDHQGFVVPVTMTVPDAEKVARYTLQFMTVNGLEGGSFPPGFTALIPAGTTIKGLNIIKEQKLAIVDFSKEFQQYAKEDERKLLEAITWALTQFPSIEQVELWVEGTRLKQMPKAGTPLDEPLNRNLGINLQQTHLAPLGQTTPVTLYFRSETWDHQPYFVPVTRFVPQTEDIALATIEHLIKGPMNDSLASVIFPKVEILGVNQSEDLLHLHFSEHVLNDRQEISPHTLQSIVLSLTENTDYEKVQILINRDMEVFGADQKNWSQPVSRPLHINYFES